MPAGQGKMPPIEADVNCAAIMPGVYASVKALLVEMRKRIGAGWVEELMKRRDGGSKILDAVPRGSRRLARRERL